MLKNEKEESLAVKYLRIFVVVFLYWLVSISLVFINKTLLSGQSDGRTLEAPLFMAWFQCVVSVALIFIITAISRSLPFSTNASTQQSRLPNLLINVRLMAVKVMPLSTIFVITIALNTMCLKNVDVAFYQIGRSLVTVFNVILSWFLLGEKTSAKALMCCAVILAGFGLGVDQENIAGSLSFIGTFYGVMASIFVPLNAIYTKKTLPSVNQSVWLLGFCNNLNACFLFPVLMILHGEFQVVLDYEGFGNVNFWFMMASGGVFGFAINFLTGLQIQVTSPLTHNISGTAKACAQTILATNWYGETKTFLWWVSNISVLAGSAAYTRVRQIDMERNHIKNNSSSHTLVSQDDKKQFHLTPAATSQTT